MTKEGIPRPHPTMLNPRPIRNQCHGTDVIQETELGLDEIHLDD